MNKLFTLTALGTILAASAANAAGFHLREQSPAAQGNAFAGATAGAENASYAYFNVAGLTRQKGTQINMGGTYIAPEASASNIEARGHWGETGDIQNIVHSAVAPNGTVSYQLNDDVTLGVALNIPFGMITKHNPRWAGAAHGDTSRVTAVTTTPMVAWKATDKLSLGAGLPIQYVRARLTSRTPVLALGTEMGVAVRGDTVDVGYQLGALYEFTDATRVGVAYRSEINHKIKGKVEATLPDPNYNQDIFARLDLPAMLSTGIYHDINDKWAVMAEYQRVFWSSFDTLDIVGNSFYSRTYENWEDSDFFSVGASYQIDDQWKARFGLAYDQGAVKLDSRTPRIPDSDRIWYSVGLNYQYNDNLSFDMAFTYIDAKKAVVDTAATQNTGRYPDVYAEYSNSVKMWGLSMNYKF